MDSNMIMASVLNTKPGNDYYRFTNADGKMWIMPAKNLYVALNIYQPGGIKGKMLKTFFPLLHQIPIIRRCLGIQSFSCDLNPVVKDRICHVLGIANVEFCVFQGAPSATQKLVVQLSDGKRILGYCKLSDSPSIIQSFQAETNVLEYLKKSKINYVPESLYCGEVLLGVGIFIQTTLKTSNSVMVHRWMELHNEFLKSLAKKTTLCLPFESTNYYQYLIYLEENLNIYPQTDRNSITNAIKLVNTYYSRFNRFSFFHGDFTPWNSFIENGNLFVFDWECAEKCFPPYLDAAHFVLQIGILEKKLELDDLWNYLHKSINQWKVDHYHPMMICMAYLLYIIAYYSKLYKGNYNFGERNYILRIGLLKKIIKNQYCYDT